MVELVIKQQVFYIYQCHLIGFQPCAYEAIYFMSDTEPRLQRKRLFYDALTLSPLAGHRSNPTLEFMTHSLTLVSDCIHVCYLDPPGHFAESLTFSSLLSKLRVT